MNSTARHAGSFSPAGPHRKGLVLALALLSGTTLLTACKKQEAPAAPPPAVQVATPLQRDVPVYLDLVGQAQGKQDVEIRARVEGYLESVNFTEGSFVHQGDLLYQIDPKPFEADLANEQAHLTKASNDVARLQPLAAKQAVSQEELDNALSARDAARAQVELARLNLGYTHITAPIDGIVGITQVKAGNLVGRGESTLLTTVSQVDPIVFRVGISEAEYLKLARQRANNPRAPQRDIGLQLADGSTYGEKGQLDAIERAVDANTGTLAVQFNFANPDRLIRPGQYGRVRIMVDNLKSALLVPQRAVNEIQGLYQIAVLTPENKISLRMVKVGPRVDNLWVITEGLQPGEPVVVEGVQRVRDGMTVNPATVPADPAAAAAAPTP